MKYRAVEPGRLERIVTAFGNKGSTDEGYPGETVEQPELTHRVGEVDICLIGDRLAAAASGDTQSALGQHHVNSVAARRMTRNDYRQEAGVARCDVTMDARGNVFLAGVRAGREPDWPRIDLTIQLLELATVDRQGGGGGLQVADRADFSRAEMPQPFGLLLILSETHRKRLEHRTDQPRPLCQRTYDRAESRPLTSAIGTPRAWVDSIKLGHSSDSTQTARSGRQ